jgi:eukaryotic-like serine/threonine-protein kinase
MLVNMAEIKKGTQISLYRITEVLPEGRGGMARVYGAENSETHQKVALKISHSDGHDDSRYEAALRAEAEILMTFNHPGVIRILPLPFPTKYGLPMARATDIPSKPWYYAMEFLPGKPLKNYITGSKGMPEQPASMVVGMIADALIHVHQHHYAHLDVKPENIVFRYPLKKGEAVDPVLIDFGIAAHVKTSQTDAGSLAFMPPERIRQVQKQVAPEYSQAIVDPVKVDIYALGVLFYETLTGRLPFNGMTQKGLTSAILNHALVRPRLIRKDISPALEELLLALLSELPQERPSLEDVIYELNRSYPRIEQLEGDIPLRH